MQPAKALETIGVWGGGGGRGWGIDGSRDRQGGGARDGKGLSEGGRVPLEKGGCEEERIMGTAA